MSNVKGLVTLSLTLERVVWHIPSCITPRPLHTCTPNFIRISKNFVDGRTHEMTDGWTDIEIGFTSPGRLEGVDLKCRTVKCRAIIVHLH